MKILAISYSFPHKSKPYSGVFVKNTLTKISELGHHVTVIAPQRYLREKKMLFLEKDGSLDIVRPSFLSFGAKKILGLNTQRITQKLFNNAVFSALDKVDYEPDVIYSHFLLPSGQAALCVGKRLGKAVFCVLGESDLLTHENSYSRNEISKMFASFDGVIANSYQLKEDAVNRYSIHRNKIFYVPNGVDKKIFFNKDKIEARIKLGFPINSQIVIFVGSFNHRKGVFRVADACRNIKDRPKMIFVGAGVVKLVGDDVLFAGSLSHNELPEYLSAADVFVLPTLNEGMPNSIIEAMACGLPIVTTSIKPNVELLGIKHPFFCDPMNPDDIGNKISKALRAGKQNYKNVPDITMRATSIISILSKENQIY